MNIIMICTDSFRADYLGCYGNDWIKTPYLDKFAKEAILFESCYGESLPTVPARRIWFTGKSLLPFDHKEKQPKGVYPYFPGWGPLKESDVSIAEILQAQGYYTGLVTDLWHYFKPTMNMHRGFDNWQLIRGQEGDPWRTGNKDDFHPRDHLPEHLWTPIYEASTLQYLMNTQDFHSEEDYFCAKTFRTAAQWLEHNVNRKPFFLWVETFDPHEPFDCPKSYADMYYDNYPCDRYIYSYGANYPQATEADLRAVNGVYAGSCSFVDRWTGYLLDTIERLGLYEDTMVIFTSDHGTEIGEHGEVQKHPYLLHHQVTRLPLLVRHPDSALNGQRVNGLVSALDFMPTMLKFLNEKSPRRLDGKDFMPLAQGKKKKIHDYLSMGYSDYGAIRTLDWNYIFPTRKIPPMTFTPYQKKALPPEMIASFKKKHPPRLYDLNKDFDETRNVIKKNPKVVKELNTLARSLWPKAVLG